MPPLLSLITFIYKQMKFRPMKGLYINESRIEGRDEKIKTAKILKIGA